VANLTRIFHPEPKRARDVSCQTLPGLLLDLAFAYEALARASSAAGEKQSGAEYLALAKEAGDKIAEKDDRDYFFSELESIKP